MEPKNVRTVYVGDCAEEASEATDICSGKYQICESGGATLERYAAEPSL